MLEVGAVGRPGRPHHHGGLLAAARGHRAQGVQQQRGVVVDRPDRVLVEQVRHQPAHGDPVLQHVRDARRHAHVVLQHLPGAVDVADQVAAGHVAPHATGRADAVGRAGEVGPRDHQLPGHDALADDAALVVDVLHEPVQRPHALGHAALDDAPLGRGHDPRDQVQRERAVLDRPVVAAGLEGDALLHEDGVAAVGRGGQAVGAQALERLGQRLRVGVGAPGRVHGLVEEAVAGLVVADQSVGVLVGHERVVLSSSPADV